MFCSSRGSYIHISRKKYITTIEKLSFNLAHVRIIGSMECGKTINDCYHDNASNKNIKLKKDYAENSRETTGIEIGSQHWGGNRKWPMEGIAFEYVPNSIDHSYNKIIWISFMYKRRKQSRCMWYTCSYDSFIKRIVVSWMLVSGISKVW